jgi:dihydrofolate reductase
MRLIHVVAAAENQVIGKDNQLLWHLPNDLKFFKNLTWGFPVIMGRKTFESVNKPLPGRTNIVITRQTDWQRSGVDVVATLEEAILRAQRLHVKQAFIIGGGEVYRQSLDQIHEVYLTRVAVELQGDTWYPALDASSWILASEESFPADAKHMYAYAFQHWARHPDHPLARL